MLQELLQRRLYCCVGLGRREGKLEYDCGENCSLVYPESEMLAPLPLEDTDSSIPDDPDLGIVKNPEDGLGGDDEVNSMFPR